MSFETPDDDLSTRASTDSESPAHERMTGGKTGAVKLTSRLPMRERLQRVRLLADLLNTFPDESRPLAPAAADRVYNELRDARL